MYYKKRDRRLIILLAEGDKGTQAKDIKAALRLARAVFALPSSARS